MFKKLNSKISGDAQKIKQGSQDIRNAILHKSSSDTSQKKAEPANSGESTDVLKRVSSKLNSDQQRLKQSSKAVRNIIINNDLAGKKEKVPLDDIADQLQSGDLVLFAGNVGLRAVTRSYWSHVGIVIRLESGVHVIDSTIKTYDKRPGGGTQCVTLEESLACFDPFDASISVRRLGLPSDQDDGNRVETFQKTLEEFRDTVMDAKYSTNLVELLRVGVGADFSLVRNTQDAMDGTLFCSELVAAAYQALGLLPTVAEGGLAPSAYTPKMFSTEHSNLGLLQGALLGEEVFLQRPAVL